MGLEGQPDEIIYLETYKKKRIFLTHDSDFLDNRKFELKFATPTIILPTKQFEKSLSLCLYHIAPYFQVFTGTKIQISPEDASFSITLQDISTGKIEHRRLRHQNGYLEIFEEG